MAAGRRDDQRALGALLAVDIRDIGNRAIRRFRSRDFGFGQWCILDEVAQYAAEVGGLKHLDAGGECGLGAISGGNDHAPCPGIPDREGERERASHGPEATVEREFTQQSECLEAFGIQCSCRREDSDRDREIQPRIAFAQACGCEVDGDSAIWKSLADARDRGADAGGAFSHGRFGKSHDVDPR